MNDYDDMGNILDDLYEDALSISYGKLSKELKEAYRLEAEHSYTLHDPKREGSRYRNDIGGSFADAEHHVVDVDISKNGISMDLHNERRSDCNCSYCRSKNPYLDTFIEEGIAGNSSITPKPVIDNTYDRLDNEELIENVLASELKKRGYNVV